MLISQENIDTLKVKTNWKTNGNAIFLINQSSFSNWTSGGQSSVSGTLKINYNLNYFDNGWAWDTKILSAFGLNKISGSDFLKKTDDRIEINSVVGKKFNNNLIGKWSTPVFSIFKPNLLKDTVLEKILMEIVYEQKSQGFFHQQQLNLE